MRRILARRTLALAGITVVTLTAAACSDKPSGSAASSPIVVGVISQVGTPQIDLPQVWAGVKAAALAVNKAGGINGHKIDVQTCNTHLDPNQEVTCAQTLIRSGAVALVGSNWALNDGAVMKVLQASDVANIGSTTAVPADFTGPAAFPVDFFPGTFYACGGQTAATLAKSSKTVIAVSELPVTEFIAGAATSAAKADAVPLAPQVSFPISTADFGPIVQRLKGSGAQLVVLSATPSTASGVLQGASQQGVNLTYCAYDTAATGQQLISLGKAASSFYFAATLPPLSQATAIPELARFKAEMAAEEATGDKAASTSVENYNAAMLRAWLGMQAFDQVAKSMTGEITASTFLPKISQAHVNLGKGLPDLDFAHPRGAGPFPKVFAPQLQFVKWDDVNRTFLAVPDSTFDSLPLVAKATS